MFLTPPVSLRAFHVTVKRSAPADRRKEIAETRLKSDKDWDCDVYGVSY
jgi:hypothetical protein